MPRTNEGRYNWKISMGIGLVALSILLYIAHYAIFRDAKHIWIYLIGDIAFLPVDALLVVIIFHQVLTRMEKKAMMKKLNMVIGAFFTEVGTDMLRTMTAFDTSKDSPALSTMLVRESWSKRDFSIAGHAIRSREAPVDSTAAPLAPLCAFLAGKRGFLVRLLENSNLLEHESFTDTLWAVLHLSEELSHRKDLAHLPPGDMKHLSGDMNRAYSALSLQWLGYMRHLNENYPYLFSLAMRTNPFDKTASVEIK